MSRVSGAMRGFCGLLTFTAADVTHVPTDSVLEGDLLRDDSNDHEVTV